MLQPSMLPHSPWCQTLGWSRTSGGCLWPDRPLRSTSSPSCSSGPSRRPGPPPSTESEGAELIDINVQMCKGLHAAVQVKRWWCKAFKTMMKTQTQTTADAQDGNRGNVTAGNTEIMSLMCKRNRLPQKWRIKSSINLYFEMNHAN